MTQDVDLLALSRRLAKLAELPPLDRAIEADALASAVKRQMAIVRRAAAYEATRKRPWSEVAEALGVAESNVNRMITLHRRANPEA